MKRSVTFLALCLLGTHLVLAQADSGQHKSNASVTTTAYANSHQARVDDEQGVFEAVEDYLEGLYQVQPERIERSVSKQLVKYGYWRTSADQEYMPSPMNYDQLVRLASGWNTDNKNKIDDNTPREIVVLDVLDKTAVAKLTAQWGIDYFQLEKTDGKWMIRHVLWQAHPIPADH